MIRPFWRRPPAPRVSVVVPLYNHAEFIEGAIASILEQGALVKDIVVIDDGSTDQSAVIMKRLSGRDSRIRFESRANRGAHATINEALSRCSGELLAILNSDDLYRPNRLNKLVALLDSEEDADIAASAIGFVDGAGSPIQNGWYGEALAFYRAGAELGVSLLNGNFLMTTSNLVFRRTLLESVGGFAPLRYAHDLDWVLRALAFRHRIVISDELLLSYRVHGRNTIAEDHSRVRAEWAMVAAAYLTALWDRPGAPPAAWDHAAAVQLVLRRHELDRAVPPCMAHLRRHGSKPLDRSPLPEDEDFRRVLSRWV